MGINTYQVSRKMWASRLHCFTAVMVMIGIVLVILAAATEFGISRAAIVTVEGTVAFSLFAFVFNEWIVVLVHDGVRADPEKYERVHRLVDETCKNRNAKKPRIYIISMKSKIGDPVPNAVAFGMGIFGQQAVAITERIDELLEEDELKAVLDHELGHIASKDIGVMTVVQILVGGSRSIGQLILNGRSPLGATPLSMIIGGVILLTNRLLFPIALSAVSQEREYAADAFSAQQSGSPDPMIRALNKIQVEFKAIKDREREVLKEEKPQSGAFDELFISHPVMCDRIASLESLRA